MPQPCCGSTTCARDRVPAGLPGGNHLHNSERALDGRGVALHSIQGGSINPENYFCCVTTRGWWFPGDENSCLGPSFWMFYVVVAVSLPQRKHDAGDFLGSDGAPAAAWLPASDEPRTDNPDPGSIAGSSGVAGRSVRSLCGDRPVAVNADRFWSNHLDSEYHGLVPWELVSLGARPGRLLISFLGHFYVMASLFLEYTPHQSFSLITPVANGDQCATGTGEGNVIGAAASALLEVNGEGYFCI